MLYIIGIAIAFFLFLLMLGKKGKSTADKILAAWLFVIGIQLLLFYLHGIIKNFQYPGLLGVEIPLPLIAWPFLYLYTAAATNHLPRKKINLFLHFLPVFISYLFMIRFFMLPPEQKIYVYQNDGKGFELFLRMNFYAIIVLGIVYTVWSILLLRQHKLAILNQFSYTEKINLNWLRYLIYGLTCIWLVIIISGSDNLIFGSVVLFVLFMGYFGIRQGNIFTNPAGKASKIDNEADAKRSTELASQSTEVFTEIEYPMPAGKEEAVDDESNTKKKYLKSGLTKESSEIIHKKLTEVIDSEKPFTNGELSLAVLASRLDVHPNILSQVINETEGKNFYDFINIKRIEEFKRIVAKPDSRQFTLLALAFECGFNSKTSFNRQFKKVTGVSPSEYLEQLKVEIV